MGGLWQTHVYNEKDEWMGLFKDETTAADWAKSQPKTSVNPGWFEVTRTKPVKGKKP